MNVILRIVFILFSFVLFTLLIVFVMTLTSNIYKQYVPSVEQLSTMKRNCEQNLPRNQVCKVKVEFYPTESVKEN